MLNTLSIFAAPSKVFEHLKVKPGWAVPFSIVLTAAVLMAWFKSCLRAGSFELDLTVVFATAIGSSILVLLVWFTLATLIYFAAALLIENHSLKYRLVWSLVSHTSLIFLLGEIINFLLVRLPFLASASYPVPNRFPTGLDIFLWNSEPNLFLAILLHSINPITVWCFAVLVMGISSIGETSKAKAATLVFILWAFGVGFIEILVLVVGGTTVRINLS